MQTVLFTGNPVGNFRPIDLAHKSQDYYTKLFKEIDKAEKPQTVIKPVSNFVKRTREYYDSLFAEIDEQIARGGDKSLLSMVSGEPAVTFVNPRTGLFSTIYSKDSKKIITVMDPFKSKGIPNNSEMYITKSGKIHKTVRNKSYQRCGILKNSSENSDKFVWTGDYWKRVPKTKPAKKTRAGNKPVK